MYNDELVAKEIALTNLFLDPNNPRFWTEQEVRETPDSKIPESKVQEQTLKRIEKFGVEELYYSILRNGFLPLDRIVVRPIKGYTDMYVTVEGNRRLAALKLLHRRISEGVINEDGIDQDYLNALLRSTEKVEVLVYKGVNTGDISWLLQGIRHISGIRDWQPAQRARLIAQQIEGEDGTTRMTFTQAGQKFGLSARAAGRLYRAYKGLQQMREDDDFGPKAKNEYFSLFEEAYKNNKVKEWLGWNDRDYKFENTDHLKQFYGWITPDEDHSDERRIDDPKEIQKVAILLEKNREDLIGQVDRYETNIDAAVERATETSGRDWEKEIERATDIITGLPLIKIIRSQPKELKAALADMRDIIDDILKRINSN